MIIYTVSFNCLLERCKSSWPLHIFGETAHFLKACGFCKHRLIPGRDIYMHRSDTSFCSLEYRQQDKPEDAEFRWKQEAEAETLQAAPTEEKICLSVLFKTRENNTFKPAKLYKVQSRCELPSQEITN
ncbi:hypothetical protein ACFX1X_013053 [Malus domestica]